jgi:hypothetical protein
MDVEMGMDESMKRFRLASRELYNNFFHVLEPYHNDGWLFEERFSAVQILLFEKLVSEPEGLSGTEYGDVQNEIVVKLAGYDSVPIMINREVNSGYWDHPIREVINEARLLFINFFDWDQLDYRDNRYVRVQIDSWESHPDTAGKHALIESHHVQFVKEQPA